MPMDRTKYPPDWDQISRRIRERAGQRCEQCGVANGAIGARDRFGTWHNEEAIHAMNSEHGDYLFGGEFPRIIRIVLTVHHLGVARADGSPGDPGDKLDCRPENLQALCQRCHLALDRPHHLAVQAENRKRRKLERASLPMTETGQYTMQVEPC